VLALTVLTVSLAFSLSVHTHVLSSVSSLYARIFSPSITIYTVSHSRQHAQLNTKRHLPILLVHGTGYFESDSSTTRANDMIQLDSTAYTISKDGTAKAADRGACMSHTSVVVFQPTHRFKAPPGTSSNKIKEEVFSMGRNTPMSFSVKGAFKSITTEQKSFEGVKGTIFGFVIPTWQKEVSGDGLVCCFLSEDKKSGGRVKEFETGQAVEVDWAKCGRFHLGFPQDDEYEELKI
jgi:alpha-acetolactate decarboxylase